MRCMLINLKFIKLCMRYIISFNMHEMCVVKFDFTWDACLLDPKIIWDIDLNIHEMYVIRSNLWWIYVIYLIIFILDFMLMYEIYMLLV